jgi:glutamate racemase
MAIGVFDSGVGGLAIHHALVERLPQADFIYLADQANTPYGGRPGPQIADLTRAGCERLFEAGANLIILACNTASAIALRWLQRDWLPEYRRDIGRSVNMLGIIVPTIEAATGLPWQHKTRVNSGNGANPEVLGVFCTPATAASQVYEIEIDKRRDDVTVVTEPCPALAGLIEGGAGAVQLATVVEQHVLALHARLGRHPDRVILGCTHYEIIADMFRAALPPSTHLIHQPKATADAIEVYLRRHPEYPAGTGGARHFLTTGKPGPQSGLVETFWGEPLDFQSSVQALKAI